jgi:DNA-binding response OmpR family regulator
MPSPLDDVALASVWRRKMQGRPVLFVSGHSGSLLDENALGRPHEAVLHKPFQRAILQYAVRLLLARHVSAAMPASASVGGSGAMPPRSGCAL